MAFLAILTWLIPIAKAEDGKVVYNKICYFCHDVGLVGSPEIGDTEEWLRRRDKGLEMLYHNTLTGTGHMMERLYRRGYNEADIKNAVDYLLKQSE